MGAAWGAVLTPAFTATRASATTGKTAAASTRAALGFGSFFSTCADLDIDMDIGLDIDLDIGTETCSRPSFPRPATPTPTKAISARSPAACFNGRIIRCLLHVTTNSRVPFIRRVWRASAAAARARRTASR